MINLIAPINTLGYGVVGINVLKALSRGTEVALWSIGQPQVSTEEEQAAVVEALENAQLYDPEAPCIRIWHQHDLAHFAGNGLHVGFPIFELDDFNKIERHHLESVDQLFVCSNWAKSVVEQYVPTPVDVIPLGVDTQIFKPTTANNTGDTIFFNCGKWEVRKGHPELIKAFLQAFDANDKVQLWLMCDNPFNTDKEDAQWYSLFDTTEHYRNGRIKIIPRVKTHQEVYNIMRQVDCGVFPSRAEGWNLEALEILACGKQLIITDYSAHTEFCNAKNSMLIPIAEKELAFDNKWFFGQGSWAKLDNNAIDSMIGYMRSVHKTKTNGGLEINIDGIETANTFTWDNTAKRIIECLIA